MQHEHTRVSFAQGEEVVNISHYEEGMGGGGIGRGIHISVPL